MDAGKQDQTPWDDEKGKAARERVAAMLAVGMWLPAEARLDRDVVDAILSLERRLAVAMSWLAFWRKLVQGRCTRFSLRHCERGVRLETGRAVRAFEELKALLACGDGRVS